MPALDSRSKLLDAIREIKSLKEQLENCQILMARIENERNELVAENQRLARAWEAMRLAKEKAKANEKEMFDAALKTDQEPVAWCG